MTVETVHEGRTLVVENNGKYLFLTREQANDLCELLPSAINQMPVQIGENNPETEGK